MTKISILPVESEAGTISFHAMMGAQQVEGRTAGEALDALTAQLTDDDTNSLVLVQRLRPDRFFNAAQSQRMAELMERWRTCRDNGLSLSDDETAELEGLIEAELRASADRSAEMAEEIAR